MLDSCGIFFCRPIEHVTFCYPMHSMWSMAGFAELDEIEENGGPGQQIKSYLPQGVDIQEKVTAMFNPVPPNLKMAWHERRGPPTVVGERKPVPSRWQHIPITPSSREGLHVIQKHMHFDKWAPPGMGHHKGSHYPISVNLGNPINRSTTSRRNRGSKRTPGKKNRQDDQDGQ